MSNLLVLFLLVMSMPTLSLAKATSAAPQRFILSLGQGMSHYVFSTHTIPKAKADLAAEKLKLNPEIKRLQEISVSQAVFKNENEFYNCVGGARLNSTVSLEAAAAVCGIYGSMQPKESGYLFMEKGGDDILVVSGAKTARAAAMIDGLHSGVALSKEEKAENQKKLPEECSFETGFNGESCRFMAQFLSQPSRCKQLPGGENSIDSQRQDNDLQSTTSGYNSQRVSSDPIESLPSLSGLTGVSRRNFVSANHSLGPDHPSLLAAVCLKCPRGTIAKNDICRDVNDCDALHETWNQRKQRCESNEKCDQQGRQAIFGVFPINCEEDDCIKFCKDVVYRMKDVVSLLNYQGGGVNGTVNVDLKGPNISMPSGVIKQLRNGQKLNSAIGSINSEINAIEVLVKAGSQNCSVSARKNCEMRAEQVDEMVQSLLKESCDGVWIWQFAASNPNQCIPKACQACTEGLIGQHEPMNYLRFSRIGTCSASEVNQALMAWQTSLNQRSLQRLAACRQEPAGSQNASALCNFKKDISQKDLEDFMRSIGMRCVPNAAQVAPYSPPTTIHTGPSVR